jgi:rRNA maturation endonuclease Nob1
VTENLQQQKRFFCDSCKREVFLNSKFCDQCGGTLEWPTQIQNVLSSWESKNKKTSWFSRIFAKSR